MDNLFINVGGKLKKFAKAYFSITTWILIIGGVIAFFALVSEEYTAPFAFGVLLGVPLAILGNLVFCWVLHAFGSIAEKHEDAPPAPQAEKTPPPLVENKADDVQPDADQDKVFRVAIWVIVLSLAALVLLVLLGGGL